MRENVGIVRNDAELLSAKIRLTDLQKEVEGKYNQYNITTALCELRNMIQVALLIVEQSLQRSKNCGGFLKINQSVMV